jgi:NAD(P)-dependent dehydrogenase (short-subunit alcohol dehydrogenase family)
MDLNVKTPFFLTQQLLGALKAAATPRISPRSQHRLGRRHLSNPQETYSYHASKAGPDHLTKRMALRLIATTSSSTPSHPDAFASDMNRDARDHATPSRSAFRHAHRPRRGHGGRQRCIWRAAPATMSWDQR